MEALEVFPCPRCGKTFDYVNALKRHGKSCNANKPRKCRKCLQWFENQLTAARHEIVCFNDNTPLSCPFCSKQFEHLYTLQRHYRTTHHIKSSKFKKPESDFGTLIECSSPDSANGSEDYLQEEICVTEQPQNNVKKPHQSVYTIEIESVTNLTEIDSNVQTLVYNIRETTDSTEIETLPECIITDFDSIIQEDNGTDDVSDELQNEDEYDEDNIKIEYIEDDDFYIE